jgi:hypothetical protein
VKLRASIPASRVSESQCETKSLQRARDTQGRRTGTCVGILPALHESVPGTKRTCSPRRRTSAYGAKAVLAEGGQDLPHGFQGCAVQPTDHWHTRLLRAPGKRPSSRHATKKRDQLAPSQMAEPHLPPPVRGPIAAYPKWRIAVRGSVTYFAVLQETHGMSSPGTLRTCRRPRPMSGIGAKPDVAKRCRHVAD